MSFFRKIERFEFPNEIEVGGFNYKIIVEFFKKRSSSVVLKDDTLFFRFSLYLSEREKKEHFEELLEKMLKKIRKSPPRKESKFKEYLDLGGFTFANERFIFLGKNRKSVALRENVFLIPSLNSDLKSIEKAVSRLLAKRFETRMREYVYALNYASYNYEIKDVVLSYVGSKWGHCTHDNVIMINIKLLRAPKAVMDYVIYHEISHIRYKNHSDRFWREVSRYCPNYKKLRKYLKLNPLELF